MFTYTYLDEFTLQDVEDKRNKLKRVDRVFILLTILSWAQFIYALITGVFIEYTPLFLPFILMFITILLIIRNRKVFIKYYKDNLVNPNIRRNFPDFQYESSGCITEATFKNSGMFQSFNSYSGDDYFRGEQIEFSELDVSYVTRNGNSHNRRNIFQGIFLVAELPVDIDAPITIRKRINIDKVPQIFHRFLPEWMKNPKNVVLTGRSDFDNEFLLQSVSSRVKEIFTPGVIDKLLSLGKESENPGKSPMLSPVVLSIKSNRLYMGISGIRLFSVRYNKGVRETSQELEKSIKIIRDILDFRELLSI